ncbi:MAG: hypothetical protein DRJ26_01060 [Candidatus Methanomethylicota archaeon]|uniref:Uncharacterized protein n=1 Tax=Thermoproteota archaeon TaxID=2056631 RepID=A0A497EWI0_9CREN|nr:MAG: hypothetical protein DRJ20_01925 [Candidatus Verstraetearchaeota archaeon]RLE55216.1 MAG: hypothetical protein DRJ26_01060 [Candidatus Verstraetearchaeota archaeon]
MNTQAKEVHYKLSIILLLFGGFILLSSKTLEWKTWFHFTFILGLLCLIAGLIIGILSTYPSREKRAQQLSQETSPTQLP